MRLDDDEKEERDEETEELRPKLAASAGVGRLVNVTHAAKAASRMYLLRIWFATP